MEQIDKKSNKLLWIVLASIGAFLVLIGIFVMFLAQMGTAPQSSSKDTTATSSTDTKAVTSSDVKKNLDDVNASLKQAKTAEDAAKAALDDEKNQIKLDS
ncbi:MAG: hypothetical protein H6797_03810 [Candidatus Nomurabacteria bacterium]|nr:MAG: hypothetical protein H6797_03810 [Candidatus Nomurabacteria bacterium]